MRYVVFSLLKKDFRLMLASKFFLLALGSLILYSCYINLVYVRLDQEIYPVYLYDPMGVQSTASSAAIRSESAEQMHQACSDGYSVGIDASGRVPRIYMVSSGIRRTDNSRAAYAVSLLFPDSETKTVVIGTNTKEMKNRREITCEFLFFELSAVGFLGLASTLFKEKQMGVIRVHSTLPVSQTYIVLSKLVLFLAGQTGISWKWIRYHPMYHLFMALKNAYFGMKPAGNIYYAVCAAAVLSLFMLVCRTLKHEMAKEG